MTFLGWYNETGRLLGRADSFDISQLKEKTIIARFTEEGILGDIDGNGSISIADAINILHIAMGLYNA